MARIKFILCLLALLILVGALHTSPPVEAAHSQAAYAPLASVSAYDLIIAMNTLRVSNGLPALLEDPIINAVAQSTAATMAANQMSWHIGDVSGRLAAAGYGGGDTVWATENFAVGTLSLDQIMIIWSDASHMIPAVNPAYCNVGAGTAKAANGQTYYVLQAAYVAGKACGTYQSSGSGTGSSSVPQVITPVKLATPDKDGRIYHGIEAGQTLWAIAIAYKITVQDLETWNNISRETPLHVGQRLFIPSADTAGYHTPTPVGMIQISTPDSLGRIFHTVQEYQNLTTIAKAYGTTIGQIAALNAIQTDWPLSIGQRLLIDPGHVTPSPTPRPLTPLEQLTPAGDGKYYHIVQPGENLSWIAALYEVTVADLMAWNGLSGSSVLRPDQQLLLQVTPPATSTPTLAPASVTPTRTAASVPPTSTASPMAESMELGEEDPSTSEVNSRMLWAIPIVVVLAGALLFIALARKKS